jgi:cell division septation protein DedD
VVGPGTARVEIVALESPPSAAPVTTTVRSEPVRSEPDVRAVPLTPVESEREAIYIQLGSFSKEANALSLRTELETNKEKPIVISQVETAQGPFFRVLLGPLVDVDEAVSVQKRLKRKGYDLTRILLVED